MSEIIWERGGGIIWKTTSESLIGARSGVIEVSFDDATRNIIVLGGTGRGKTQSVLLPAAARMIECGCGGLILDVKGDFSTLAAEFPDRIDLLGPSGRHPINLIAGLEPGVLRVLLDSLRSQHGSKEAYWGAMGVEDAILVALALRERGKEPTLADLHAALVEPSAFCERLERWLWDRPRISEALQRQITARNKDEFSILSVGGFQGYESSSSHGREQYSWQTNALVKALSGFTANQALREAFCASDQRPVIDLQRVLVLDVNADAYPDVAVTIGKILRYRFMRAVIESYQRQGGQAPGYGGYTFLLIDEYQNFINVDTDTLQLRDDNQWFDRSRSYRHINVVATQSITSLHAKAPPEGVLTIVQNCQTTIVLPTTDRLTLERVNELTGKQAFANPVTFGLLNPKAMGTGFIHMAQHRKSKGASLAALFHAGTLGEPSYQFMNRYINAPITQRHAVPRDQHIEEPMVANPIAKPRTHLKFSGRLYLILECNLPEQRDWLERVTSVRRINFVVLIDAGKRRDIWNERARLSETLEEISDGDVVVIPFPEEKETNDLLKLSSVAEHIRQGLLITTRQGRRITSLERLADVLVNTASEIPSAVFSLLISRQARQTSPGIGNKESTS